ncbi:MAG: glycosyltransferase family A protein [Vicingaceae bacterium]
MSSLISILMPVKNAAPFLAACLESILAQDEENWELLAIDDHSSDSSRAILENYSQKEQRIKRYTNDGEGIIPALRKAYQKSKGKIIHRMDADDLMPPKKLSRLKKELIKAGEGCLVSGKVEYFAKNGLNDGYRRYADWLNQLIEQDNHWQDIYKECVIASPNWFIYRNDLDKVGAFNANRYPEDYDLVFRFYQAKLKVCSVKQLTHLWRDHEKRSSRTLEVYKNNDYLELKWHYFKRLDYQSNRPLMIWGAGPKGKKLAKVLQQDQVDFEWVSNNPNKHGKEIYRQILASFEKIVRTNNPQILVAVGQKGAQAKIKSFLHQQGHQQGRDYFFFC